MTPNFKNLRPVVLYAMKLLLSSAISLLAFVTVTGFQRTNSIHKLTKFGSSFRLKLVEANVEQVYSVVKDKIKSAISSKFTNGVPSQFSGLMNTFLDEYGASNIAAGQKVDVFQANILKFFEQVQASMEKPYQFQPFHQAIREPFDYYKWGNDFLKPMIIMDKSRLLGVENAKKINELLSKGENVMILSNHQTEADPQVLSILLEEAGLSSLAEKIIFIAGHKVTNDPVAIPFSMGRNLLCIHSKKHIKNPPEQAATKQAQNLATMDAMGKLAKEGGHVFWVAPSGGRDRPDETTGEFKVAPFDSKAIDMFKIVAMQSGKPMHFFPMTMYTHQLVPPPKSVSSSLGEERSGKRGPVSVNFLDEAVSSGGLKDDNFVKLVEDAVVQGFEEETKWHGTH